MCQSAAGEVDEFVLADSSLHCTLSSKQCRPLETGHFSMVPDPERDVGMPDNPPLAPTSLPARRRLFWLVALAAVLVILIAGGIWALTRSASSGHASLPPTSLNATSLLTRTST